MRLDYRGTILEQSDIELLNAYVCRLCRLPSAVRVPLAGHLCDGV